LSERNDGIFTLLTYTSTIHVYTHIYTLTEDKYSSAADGEQQAQQQQPAPQQQPQQRAPAGRLVAPRGRERRSVSQQVRAEELRRSGCIG
jgi:hypothetical protein